MGLSFDGYAANAGSAHGAGTVTLTTTNNDDVIVLGVYVERAGQSGTAQVSSVSGGGLSWQFLKAVTWTSAGGSDVEIWWAHAPSPLITAVITINFNGTNDDYAALAFGVSGANWAAPWDTNASLPASATQTTSGSPTVGGISTTALNTMVISFAGSVSFFAGTDNQAGFTAAGAPPTTAANSNSASCFAEYQIETAAQSGITTTIAGSRGASIGNWGIISAAIIQFVAAPAITKSQATASIGF